MFKKKTLLITGGTGSFGNAVLRRFLQTDIAEIRIFSRDEKKQDDMRHRYRSDKLRFYIGDVRNLESLQRCHGRCRLRFQRRRPEAGAIMRVLSDGGGANQRHRRRQHADRSPGCRRQERRGLEHRQGGLPDQCHGHVQGTHGEGDDRAVQGRG